MYFSNTLILLSSVVVATAALHPHNQKRNVPGTTTTEAGTTIINSGIQDGDTDSFAATTGSPNIIIDGSTLTGSSGTQYTSGGTVYNSGIGIGNGDTSTTVSASGSMITTITSSGSTVTTTSGTGSPSGSAASAASAASTAASSTSSTGAQITQAPVLAAGLAALGDFGTVKGGM